MTRRPTLALPLLRAHFSPTANANNLGGVKINGNNLSIDGNGVLASTSYALPTAAL